MKRQRLSARNCTLAILLICSLGRLPQLWAQQAGQQSATTPQTPAKPANAPEAGKDPVVQDSQRTQNDRIFWTLPNYLTVERTGALPSLTTGQKFKLVAEGTFDPWEFAFIGVVASVNQAADTNPTYGQGTWGYAKRYGTAFADNTVENFMVGGVLPSLLRQDPRYYQMGQGRVLHRAAYAALRVFVTRSDSGKTQFNFSEILGAGTAAAISNAYHPGPRTLGSNVSVWWTQIGWDAVAYELKEFWPDIHRYFQRRSHKPKA
jgi:hypothetical protein